MEEKMSYEKVVESLKAQLKPVLEGSKQGVYVYVDDSHKFCNGVFAEMLGYASADEWSAMDGSFPQLFVAEQSHGALIGAYRAAKSEFVGSANQVTWKKKDGSEVATTVILVPLPIGGEVVALHYISA